MRNSITEFFVWLFMWFGIGLLAGYYFGGQAWQLIPFIGILFGLVGGVVYSIASFICRANNKQYNIFIASLLGLLASACTIPILVIGSVELIGASIFALIAGPTTGVCTYFIVQIMYSNESTS